jgi:cold-inducible RNA-binding protein
MLHTGRFVAVSFTINFFIMNIFVAKLNFGTQSEDLRAAFEAFGEVDSAKVIEDHFTGKSRGFGFVEMPNDDEARAAIEALNESELDGNTIVVKKAEPRKGGGGGQGGGRDFNRGGGGGGRDYNRGGGRDYNRGGGGGDYNRGGSRDYNRGGGRDYNRGGDSDYNRDDYNKNRY